MEPSLNRHKDRSRRADLTESAKDGLLQASIIPFKTPRLQKPSQVFDVSAVQGYTMLDEEEKTEVEQKRYNEP